MQVCKQCGANQLEGTVFCTECGASLLEPKGHSETTVSLGRLTSQSYEVEQATVVPVPESQPDTYVVNLVVLNSGRRLKLDVGKSFLIGRGDMKKSITPDVDLGRDGGYDAGVSRQHARIAVHHNSCTIEDLRSTNGTFINGRRLSPFQPTTIGNGDELKFGTLLLRIEFST